MSFASDYMLSILLACLLVLIVTLLRKRLHYFSSRGIPYVKPTWKSMMKSLSLSHGMALPSQAYENESGKDKSIIGVFHVGLSPAVLILDPSMVESVFIKDFSHFHDHGLDFDISNDPLAGHLFNMKGDQWRTLRNKLLPTFTSGKLKGMIPAMESCAQSLIHDMNGNENLRQDVELKELFRQYTLAVIASCAFGIEPESIKDTDSNFQRFTRTVLKPTLLAQIKIGIIITMPKLAKLLKLKFIPQDIEDFFLNLTRCTLEMRKNSGLKRNDFIQLLLELKEKGSVHVDHKDLEEDEKDRITSQLDESDPDSSKLEMTTELLAAQVFVFLIAGFDNSAYIVAIASYLLSKNKDIQQRVREEVKTAKGKHGGMNYLALKDMELLEASIKEALRIYPPIDILLRRCTKTYTLKNGLKIEKGMSVMIPAKSLQNDSKYWTNPEEFIPDRFLDNPDIQPGTYMPFGDGPRVCIAQRLALLMGKVMLADVVDNFELFPSEKTQEPLKLRVVVTSEVIGGIWGSFQPIKQ